MALEDGAQVLQDGCCLLGSGSMRSGSRGSTRCATSCQRDLAPVVFLSLYQVLGLGINMQAISGLAVGTPMHKALLVHPALRACALFLMRSALRKTFEARQPVAT